MHNEYHTVIYIEFGFTLMADGFAQPISAAGLIITQYAGSRLGGLSRLPRRGFLPKTDGARKSLLQLWKLLRL